MERFEEETKSGPPHCPTFEMRAYIGNTKLAKGIGNSKKAAKRKAAETFLSLCQPKRRKELTYVDVPFIMKRPQTFHDNIAKLCHEKFDAVVADIPEKFTGRKVIAGVVMKSKINTFEVISLASGTRFITGKSLTTDGQVLVDSHAEILAVRGMKRFLYHHINQLTNGQLSTVLQCYDKGKVELVSGIKFHLYISTAPCGDGAVFTPSSGISSDADVNHRPIFGDKKQGLLRTKIQQGEGHIPTKDRQSSCTYQGMDAVRNGERLRVMSCSDKLCKWNLLGVQGALLANLMEPVYLNSITLGNLYNHGHMARAMCCRLKNTKVVENLPFGYKLNHPLLGGVSHKTPQRKSTAYSINWNRADACREMTDGTTGRLNEASALMKRRSRLCKKDMLKSYKEICTEVGIGILVKDDYLATKKASTQYQSCKETMYTTLHNTGYGTWLGIPRECQEFSTSS